MTLSSRARTDNPAHPGCSDDFCDPNNIIDQNGNVWCGFNGAPAMAWAPRDLEKLLVTHASSGNAWHAAAASTPDTTR